uniref:Histidine decarboxylase n=1 Tax=Hofstenia miamia TaxID=442651 RepID=A0A7G7LK82_HOFMI|nr:histidine decarboxylase [Hofstenia miamia]
MFEFQIQSCLCAEMNTEEYIANAKGLVDYIANYYTTIENRKVKPDVQPGYLSKLLPKQAPTEGESFHEIFQDFEKFVMSGVTHWQSPHMHAYFPALSSYPSMLAEMLSDAINCLGFTWASSPACTELEMVVMDWLALATGMPDKYMYSSRGKGGGIISGTCCEATLTAMLAARKITIEDQKCCVGQKTLADADILSRLVAYTSDQAHSSVEKAAMISLVKIRMLPTDSDYVLRGGTVKNAILEDRNKGLIPFFVCITLGTTGCCAFDNLEEIGPVCAEEGLWLHVDAAYAGTAFLCPEYRRFLKGVQYTNSFAFNPSKNMLTNFDCTAFWIDDATALHKTFCAYPQMPLYLSHNHGDAAIDFMNWQIPLSRRFRSLKIWFVMRSYGTLGLQNHVRSQIRLAQYFENLVAAHRDYEIAAPRILGLVVFRLKGHNELTKTLLSKILLNGKIFMVPADLKGKFVLRFSVTSPQTTEATIFEDWELITALGAEVLDECHQFVPPIRLSPEYLPDDSEEERKSVYGEKTNGHWESESEDCERIGDISPFSTSDASPKKTFPTDEARYRNCLIRAFDKLSVD